MSEPPRDTERLDPEALQRLQREKLAALLRTVFEQSPFYRRKFAGLAFDPLHSALELLPTTSRAEIERDQQEHPPFGRIITRAPEAFTRLHQTSGSSGRPLAWLDTAESWQWWQRCWRTIFRAAGVTPADRFLFPFSFGPFIGFWTAFETAAACGNLVLPGGGMSTTARLELLIRHGATVVCCTPTYALRMAEVAAAMRLDLAGSTVRALIVAGEPGGSIPATRKRIETAFGARVFDHAGMTEMGAWGFECVENPTGLHVIEDEFIAEVVDPGSGQTCAEDEPGELLLTNLGRLGMPLIRYRTGDLATLSRDACPCGRRFARLQDGIQGRLDDMLIIRGNNVFPSTVEGILRTIPEVAEFRIGTDERGALTELTLEVEPVPDAEVSDLATRIGRAFVDRMHFRPRVIVVAEGTLPRFELKARRLANRDP